MSFQQRRETKQDYCNLLLPLCIKERGLTWNVIAIFMGWPCFLTFPAGVNLQDCTVMFPLFTMDFRSAEWEKGNNRYSPACWINIFQNILWGGKNPQRNHQHLQPCRIEKQKNQRDWKQQEKGNSELESIWKRRHRKVNLPHYILKQFVTNTRGGEAEPFLIKSNEKRYNAKRN